MKRRPPGAARRAARRVYGSTFFRERAYTFSCAPRFPGSAVHIVRLRPRSVSVLVRFVGVASAFSNARFQPCPFGVLLLLRAGKRRTNSQNLRKFAQILVLFILFVSVLFFFRCVP